MNIPCSIISDSACTSLDILTLCAPVHDQQMFDRGLLSLLFCGLERAEVPTPAFNAHDQFQLAGAVRLAAQQATAYTSVGVGSFAGHTALSSAAIFKELRVSNMLHAVDPDFEKPLLQSQMQVFEDMDANGAVFDAVAFHFRGQTAQLRRDRAIV